MIYLTFFYSSEGIVYNVDEMTGGLVISHRLRLPTRDYPGKPFYYGYNST